MELGVLLTINLDGLVVGKHTYSDGTYQDRDRIGPGNTRQNETSEHIEYRSLDLQRDN